MQNPPNPTAKTEKTHKDSPKPYPQRKQNQNLYIVLLLYLYSNTTMKQITFKILDTMARNLGNPLSISEITRNITKIHKHAYYKNVHDEIKNLQKQGIINISRTGNSSLLSLNTSYTGIIDTLAETETIRKRNLTEHYPNKAMLLDDIESEFRKGMYFTDSISLFESEKNFRLNRVELLFIQRTPNQDETEDFDEKKNILIK